MEGQEVQERTPERIREEFHAKVERLRGQARDLKVFLERAQSRERGRFTREEGPEQDAA